MLRRIVPMLFLAAVLPTACLAADTALDDAVRTEPLTRRRATEILANSSQIAEGLEKQLAKVNKSGSSLVLDDVRDVMAPSSEWRWYSRDHGILLAIPVRERLGIMAKVEGERALADIARRLLHQNGWANPPIQVVFIEPEIPCLAPRHCVACVAPAASAACGCD